jgi:hypothetical protein
LKSELKSLIAVLYLLSKHKGLVFDLATIPSNFASKFENNGLVGYRIEYLTTNTASTDIKVKNFFKIIHLITAEPVNQNLTNVNQKRYVIGLMITQRLVLYSIT